jgi:lipopolysaccharide/colanic/teichoic acid biosynthesis glycosyltransferase
MNCAVTNHETSNLRKRNKNNEAAMVRWNHLFDQSFKRRRLPQRILNGREVRAVLRRERSRADRRGLPVTLVVFHAQVGDRKQVDQFQQALRARLRITDDVGRLGRKRVAAVLPDTDERGARALAEELRGRFARILPMDCEVLAYPTRPSRLPDAETETPDGEDGNEVAVERRLQLYHPSRDAVGTRAPRNRPRLVVVDEDTLNPTRETDSAGNARGEPVLSSGLDAVNRTSLALAPEPTPNAAPIREGENSQRSLEPILAEPDPWWKRGIDLLGATCGLILTSPIMVTAAIAIWITSGRPIFFVQKRRGRGGRAFSMYKFRTMVVDAEKMQRRLAEKNEQDGPAFKMERDPRVTPLGGFLRGTSIDELPQLFNVLKGDMSLVGPRPLPCHESDACEDWQRQRLLVTPGLTCIWQVKDRRSKIPFADWARMDVRYIRSRTPWHDVKLIYQTVVAIVCRKGW